MTTSPLRERAANGGQQPSTEVATQRQSGIGGFLAELRPQIERALPKHLNADRMARLALTEVRKTPKLAECTPASFAGALLTAAALGLEVGTTGDAYLVPYEHHKGPMRGQTECQLIVGYQGIARLFWQHPLAAGLDAQAVHEHDDFDYAYGTAKFLRHKPAIGDRGKVICYYAVAELTTGATHFVVLSPEEVKRLRGGKVGTSGQIDDPMHWMERKTALRQCLKTLPKSTTLANAIEAEDRGGAGLYQEQAAQREVEQAQTPSQRAIEQQHTEPSAQESAPQEPPPEDPWDTAQQAGAETGEGITDAQKRKLHASLSDLGIKSHDDRVAYLRRVTGREVQSTNDLTKAEGSQVIEAVAYELEAQSQGGESR